MDTLFRSHANGQRTHSVRTNFDNLEVNNFKNVHIPLSEKTINFPPFPPLNLLLNPLKGDSETQIEHFLIDLEKMILNLISGLSGGV